MRIVIAYLLFILVATTVSCQDSSQIRNILTGEVKSDLEALIPAGTYTAIIIDSVKVESRYLALQEKFISGIKGNYEWYLKKRQEVQKTGKVMAYDPRIGMTEQEYAEFIKITEVGPDVEMFESGIEKIKFIWKDGLVLMEGSGRLNFINSIILDLNRNTVLMDKYSLADFDSVKVDTENNGLKSKWRGYFWEFSDSNKEINQSTDPLSLQNIGSTELKVYNITIGRLEKNGRTYIEITQKELYAGIIRKSIQIPFLIEP